MKNEKLPEITVNEWLEAEHQLTAGEPQPKGSVTVQQYAQLTKRSRTQASKILKDLYEGGFAEREHWSNGTCGGKHWVYWLKNGKASR